MVAPGAHAVARSTATATRDFLVVTSIGVLCSHLNRGQRSVTRSERGRERERERGRGSERERCGNETMVYTTVK